jgi:hypothetical protein
MAQKKSDNNNNMNYDNEDEENLKNKEENQDSFIKKSKMVIEDNTRTMVDTILKIIDVGLDKSYDDFMVDIQMIAEPLIKINDSFNVMAANSMRENPITEYRDYLKPTYTERKKMTILNAENEDNNYEYEKTSSKFIYESYKNSFFDIYKKYFYHLEDQNTIDDGDKKKSRFKLYQDYKIKFLLVEEKKMLSSFINYLLDVYKKVDEKSFEDKNFWRYFVPERYDIMINFTIYLVPHFDYIKEEKTHTNNSKDNVVLLSDYIAQNDYVYQTLIYTPFGVQKEFETSGLINKLEDVKNYKSDFTSP